MKKWMLPVLAVLLLLLTACGNGDNEKVVNVYNFGEYIDKELLAEFEKQTGIQVKYDMYVTNEDLYVKMQQGGGSYDLIVPSEYMIERMIKEDMLATLDFDNIPNIKNIDPALMGMSYDPDGKYAIPYFWGTMGILYNPEMVQAPVDSWDALWDPQYENQILMLDSSRQSIGIALLKLGYSINSTSETELEEAKQLLIQQRPLVYAYQVDQIKEMMATGEAALAATYSGDAFYAVRENPGLKYVIPKEGTNLWFDSMVIPKDAVNKENAEAFINFLLDAEVAAQNAEYVAYSTPNVEAKKYIVSDMKDSEIVFPDLSKIENIQIFNDPGEMIVVYDRIWTDVISGE